jgi:hypothetical protein
MGPTNRMSFQMGPGGPFRFARNPGEMMMGPQGPMMGGPRVFHPQFDPGQRSPFGMMRGPHPGGNDFLQGQIGGDSAPGNFPSGSSQEFPMPPNFPGAMEMMAGQVGVTSFLVIRLIGVWQGVAMDSQSFTQVRHARPF